MNRYSVLLRAVNVSGKNLIKMADLKAALSKQGHENVQTYIQSGNIVLDTGLSKVELQETVQKLIAEYFSCKVEVFVLDKEELQTAYNNIPYAADLPGNRVFITVLNKKPADELVKAMENMDLGGEVYHLNDKVLYYYLPDGAANTRISNSFFESKWKVTGTARNRNTIEKLLTMFGS